MHSLLVDVHHYAFPNKTSRDTVRIHRVVKTIAWIEEDESDVVYKGINETEVDRQVMSTETFEPCSKQMSVENKNVSLS